MWNIGRLEGTDGARGTKRTDFENEVIGWVGYVITQWTRSTPEIEVAENSNWCSTQTESDFKNQFKQFGSKTRSFQRHNHISKFAQPLSPMWKWVIATISTDRQHWTHALLDVIYGWSQKREGRKRNSGSNRARNSFIKADSTKFDTTASWPGREKSCVDHTQPGYPRSTVYRGGIHSLGRTQKWQNAKSITDKSGFRAFILETGLFAVFTKPRVLFWPQS